MIVDLALSVTGSQLIASVLPTVREHISLNVHVFYVSIHRLTRINEHFCMSASVVTSSLFEAAKPVLKLYGYCKCPTYL